MTVFIRLVTVAAAASLGAGAVATDSYTTDFESGADNWIAYAGSALEPTGGNPDGHIHTVFSDFGITYRNNTNPNFVMDYSAFDSVTFSIDVKVESIGSFGLFNPRPWVIELRDYDNPPAGYNYVSVWHEFMWLPGTGLPWTTFDVTIDDPSAVDLPAGWGGDGAYDPDTFEPILPADRTFTDVLANVDEIAFTTLEPGYFFIESVFDIRLDNITVTTEGGSTIPGDLNGDGAVGAEDLAILLANWGRCAGCPEDLDGDDTVGASDLAILLANWT